MRKKNFLIRPARTLPLLSMSSLLGDPTALNNHIAKNVRGIWDIQLGSSDFLPLIEGRPKIPGTTLNAFGAAIQQLAEHLYSGHSDFCIFSSLLGTLVRGEFKEGGLYGTIEGHIEAAVHK